MGGNRNGNKSHGNGNDCREQNSTSVLAASTYASEECDVEERRVRVGELKCERLDDKRIVVFSLRSVVL